MEDGVRRYFEDVLDMTPEHIEMALGNPAFIKAMPELGKWDVVAKVVTTQYCVPGLKVGQEITGSLFPHVISPEKSSAPLCGRAIQNIAAAVPGIWFEIVGGKSPESIKLQVGCADTGIEKGGFGHVELELTLHKKP